MSLWQSMEIEVDKVAVQRVYRKLKPPKGDDNNTSKKPGPDQGCWTEFFFWTIIQAPWAKTGLASEEGWVQNFLNEKFPFVL